VRHGIAQQKLHKLRIPAIAAGDAMRSKLPDVTGLRYRDLGDLRNFIFVG
jgi:hypothetical protein